MGSFTAIGGIKAGEKSVTAFESEDCSTALAVAKFKAFAKPGGSSYVVRTRRSTPGCLVVPPPPPPLIR